MKRLIERVLPLFIAALPVILMATEAWARAGGGKSKGGGIIGLILLPISILYGWYVNNKLKARQQKVESILSEMAKKEPQWGKEQLLAVARDQFLRLQGAWGNNDLEFMKKHLHPSLYPTWESQIKNFQENGVKNVMAGLSIHDMRIVDAKNFANDEMDEFTVCIDAKADDQTFQNGSLIASDDSKFREFWTFEWEKGAWTLREVTEASGWKRFISGQLVYEPSTHRKAG